MEFTYAIHCCKMRKLEYFVVKDYNAFKEWVDRYVNQFGHIELLYLVS